jgi:hypothetical protein
MLRTALRTLVRAAIVIGSVSSLATGCSRQSEGERCDYTWAGDQDCDDGLVCTPCGKLQEPTNSRCCRANGTYTDTRCIPTTNPSGNQCDTHSSSTGGTTSSGGSAGSSAGGTTANAGGAGRTTGNLGGTGGSSEEVAGAGDQPAAGTGG